MPSLHEFLLRLLAAPPSIPLTQSILTHLRAPLIPNTPPLTTQADDNGYTLTHAAASYGHVDILRVLVRELGADVNVRDADGDTPLFYAERLDVAQLLIDELGADVWAENDAGERPLDRVLSEVMDDVDTADDVEVGLVEFLQGRTGLGGGGLKDVAGKKMLNEHVQVRVGTMVEPEGEPDPVIKCRIEELAARSDYRSEDGQRELRELVQDVVNGLKYDAHDDIEELDNRKATRRKV